MQLSAKNLSKQQLLTVSQQFHTLIADLRSPRQVETFFKDFLSTTEYLVMVKRLAIAQALISGKSYEEIKRDLKVSSATISGVSEILPKKGMQLALQKMKVDVWATQTAYTIQSWLKKKSSLLFRG
jgi:uncharacterized protein YerC